MSRPLTLPDADARQWQRLRRLRVERARRALAQALDGEAAARAAVAAREAGVQRGRERLEALALHWGGAGSVDMPRWGQQVVAHREALAERLERDEYALIDEQAALDEALTLVRERRAELARAEAREAAVDATLKDQRRARQQAREQQAELDAEEAGRRLH